MRWYVLAAVVASVVLLAWFFFPEQSNASYVRGEVEACLETGESNWRGRCFRDLAPVLLKKMKLEGALAALAEIDEVDGIKQQCHALVHFLGQSAYRETKSLPQTFARCSSNIACGEGCFHGGVEAYIEETGDQLDGPAVASICSRDFTGNEVNYGSCVHGLGHAFMLLTGGDILQSLPKCDYLSDAPDREECYSGVFMENAFGATSVDHPSQFLKRDDPMYPCTIVEEKYRSACYSSQVNLVMPPGPERYLVGKRYCEDVPEAYRTECYASFGGDAVLMADDSDEVVAVCGVVPEGVARNRCYDEALKFRGHGTSGDPERIGAICFATPENERPHCFAAAGKVLEEWYAGARAEKCALVNARGTDEYSWCAEGN